jgi:hypothetical protein
MTVVGQPTSKLDREQTASIGRRADHNGCVSHRLVPTEPTRLRTTTTRTPPRLALTSIDRVLD